MVGAFVLARLKRIEGNHIFDVTNNSYVEGGMTRGFVDKARARIEAAKRARDDLALDVGIRQGRAREKFEARMTPLLPAIRNLVTGFIDELLVNGWKAEASPDWAYADPDNVDSWKAAIVFSIPITKQQNFGISSYGGGQHVAVRVELNVTTSLCELNATSDPIAVSAPIGTQIAPMPPTRKVVISGATTDEVDIYLTSVLAHIIDTYVE